MINGTKKTCFMSKKQILKLIDVFIWILENFEKNFFTKIFSQKNFQNPILRGCLFDIEYWIRKFSIQRISNGYRYQANSISISSKWAIFSYQHRYRYCSTLRLNDKCYIETRGTFLPLKQDIAPG